jgi:RHS repeat-associated protein
VLNSTGAGATSYAFTGEWQDGTSLIHLRARYYSGGQGRFITRDPWRGDYRRPLTLNGWNYVEGNPVNYTDPSGHCPKGWKPNPDGTCSFTFTTLPFSGPFGFRIKSRTITIPFPKEWCENQTPIQQQPSATATPQPKRTPTPTPGPADGIRTVTAYRGLGGTSPSKIIDSIRIDDPGPGDPAGVSVLSVYETLPRRYKAGLPFLIQYRGDKLPGQKGTVVGVLPDNTQYAIAGGQAIYTPDGTPFEHWSIFIAGVTKDQFKEIILKYAEKYFNKAILKP